MSSTQPDPAVLLERTGITHPLIGFYDAPDPAPFAPLLEPKKSGRGSPCVFDFYRRWLEGKTLHLTADNFGCGGAGRALCGVETRSREAFVSFLVDDEGLKANHELMEAWLDAVPPYRKEHPHLFIGPLKPDQYAYLRTVTFYVDADQLAALCYGAQYHAAPSDPPPVVSAFAAGCGQLISAFRDLDVAQAEIGATDVAMRESLPPDLLAFTVTKPMFERLCSLDERSFLFKSFLADLRKARERK